MKFGYGARFHANSPIDFQSYLHELPRAQLVPGVEEGVCDALLAGPAGATDAVDVVLDGEREGEVEDVLDAGDVEAARRHVRRHLSGRRAIQNNFLKEPKKIECASLNCT